MTYKVTVPRDCSSTVKLIQSKRTEAQHEYHAIQLTVTDSFGIIILDHDNTNIKQQLCSENFKYVNSNIYANEESHNGVFT